MIIDWKVIPHNQMRYDTCGDYWEEGNNLHFRVSQMSSYVYEWLIFLHEFVEYFLCGFCGIQMANIDAFDTAYENAREQKAEFAPCGCYLLPEPGMDIHAPYAQQHRIADIVERLAAGFLRVDWAAYEREVNAL